LHQIYEEAFGYESEKSAKVCMELAQIYEDRNEINNAIENYKNSFTIWEKLMQNVADYEIFITLAIKLAELYNKVQNYHDACEILKYVIKILISISFYRPKKSFQISLTIRRSYILNSSS